MTHAPRRGKVVAAALLATLATSPGQTYLVSAFHTVWRRDLAVDAAALSSAYAAATLAASTMLPFAGRLSDRQGPRRAMALAGLGLALACFAASRVSTLVQLGFVFVALRFFGQGALSLFGSHALALAFPRRLGAVEGLRNASISVAVGLFPAATVIAVTRFGWRPTYAGLGVAVAVAVGLAVALLPSGAPARARRRAPDATPTRGGGLFDALREPAWWVLASVVALHAALVTAAHFHLQPLGLEEGLSELGASRALATYAVTSLVATLSFGALADRVPPLRLLAFGCLILGAGCVVPAALAGGFALHLSLGSIGVAQGICGACVGPACLRTFGVERYGTLRGSLATAGVAGASGGPLLVALLAERLGSFGAGLAPCAALALVPALAALALARRQAPRSATTS